MPTLPKQVVVGHRTWKIRPTESKRRDGLCDYERVTLFIRTKGKTGAEQANTLLHELHHAIWDEAGIKADDTEERIITLTANVLTQVIRDNPEVFDWIAEKARS